MSPLSVKGYIYMMGVRERERERLRGRVSGDRGWVVRVGTMKGIFLAQKLD